MPGTPLAGCQASGRPPPTSSFPVESHRWLSSFSRWRLPLESPAFRRLLCCQYLLITATIADTRDHGHRLLLTYLTLPWPLASRPPGLPEAPHPPATLGLC